MAVFEGELYPQFNMNDNGTYQLLRLNLSVQLLKAFPFFAHINKDCEQVVIRLIKKFAAHYMSTPSFELQTGLNILLPIIESVIRNNGIKDNPDTIYINTIEMTDIIVTSLIRDSQMTVNDLNQLLLPPIGSNNENFHLFLQRRDSATQQSFLTSNCLDLLGLNQNLHSNWLTERVRLFLLHIA